MKIIYILIVGVLFFIISCTNESVRKDSTASIVPHNLPSDTSNEYIYKFMLEMIKEQKLDIRHGLRLEPHDNCDENGNDSGYLRSLIIKDPPQETKPAKESEPFTVTIDSSGDSLHLKIVENKDYTYEFVGATSNLENCFTREDVNYMLQQKRKLKSFSWDNSRLGFDTTNKKAWYSFSVPLFSKDHKKAIMSVEESCPGLCGSGYTMLFTKQNNVWTSHYGIMHFH